MKVAVSPEITPQYFTKVYQSGLKKSQFDAWYRGIKGTTFLKKHIVGLIKANDKFFAENPGYVEGAMCGKLKD